MENIKPGLQRMEEHVLLIPFKWVAIAAYSILVIPILLFFFGWLKWYLAIFFSGTLLFGTYWFIKNDYWDNKDYIKMPINILWVVGIAFAVWIAISGNCYISVGSWDTLWRNVTLQDLVNYDWPVYYPDKDAYLCYYFTFWMVPALIGKIFGSMSVAYIALAGWFWILLMTAFLLIAYYIKDYKKSTLKTILILMIMWSGINILGMFLMNRLGIPSPELNWGLNENYCDYLWVDEEPFNFYYRSNEDFMCEIYNQLPIWLVVPLMLENRKIRNYAFLGILIFPFSPWGTVGFALLMLVDAGCLLIKEKSVKRLLKDVISVPNVSAVISVFIVFASFFSLENAIRDGDKSGLRLLPFYKISPQIWQGILIFGLCEFGIYYCLTWKKFKKDYMYWAILIFLPILPFFLMDSKGGRDFGMNVSLPMLYVLMIFMIRYLKEEFFNENINHSKKYQLKNVALLVLLGLSFTTPLFDWLNKINVMNTNQSISVQNKQVETFADLLGYEGGWIAPTSDDVDQSLFFRYLAKPIDRESYPRLSISNELSEIRSIENVNVYLDYLAGKDCTVLIAVQDTPGFGLLPETVDRMKKLGFSNNLDVLYQKEYHSFIGISDSGKVITEQIGGDEYITYYGEDQVKDNYVWMESGTWNHGNCAAININGGYYSTHGRGFNIVVWDNAAGRVIDSVAFDTYADTITCTRKAQ